MLKHIKASELKPLIKEYLASGDFSKPFVVAGWNSTGKSTIVSETLDEVFGKLNHYLASKSPIGLASFEENEDSQKYPCLNISITERDALEQKHDYENFFFSNHIRPIIIEQTYETEEFIEELGQFSDVYVVYFDRDEWLKWLGATKGSPTYQLLSTLPDDMIHVGFSPSMDWRSRGCLFNTPKRWAAVTKHYGELAMALLNLPEESRQLVIDSLKEYCK